MGDIEKRIADNLGRVHERIGNALQRAGRPQGSVQLVAVTKTVGAAEIEDDGIPFEEKMAELSTTLYEQFAETDHLEAIIKKNLEVLGYGL